MDFPSTKWVSTGPQESSPAAPSADTATFERQLSEIANSGGGGGAMPAASALQPAQSAGVLKGHRKQPLYSEDARLISGLEEALRNGNAANHTARDYAGSLLSLGRWLFANNKDPIAARLDDQSLTDDAREAIKKGPNRRRLLLAIDHLRTFQSTGVVPITGRAELNPHPQDVALIKEYKNEAATGTGRGYATVLRSFSDYLRENNKKGIAARLSGKALDGDVESYRKDAGGNRNIGAALADLRKSQAGAKAMERERHISPVPDPEDAALMEPMPVGGAAAQHSASQDAGSWPKELLPVEGYDQDLLWELMDEPGPSSSLLEPAARHDQSSDPGESIRPLNWGSDRQQFPDEPIGALAKSNLLPSKEVLINDEHDTAELRPAKRPRTLDNLHGVAIERQLSERGGAMPAVSALQPAQSAGVLIGRSKQPLYSEDARLISGLEEALRNGNAANHTARDYAGSLLSLGRWLFANNKDPIAARLDDQSLTDDAREAIEKGHHRRLRPAIDHLRTFQSTGGVVPITGRAELNPHPQDVALIKEYKNEAATGTGRGYAAVLRSFSDYLRENNKPSIAARLSGKFLDGDVESYRKDAGGKNIGAALADLRKSQAGAKAMELERHILPGPDPENAVQLEPMPGGGAAAQHASQDAGSWPKEVLRPLNWDYDRQQFPDESIGALARSNLLPSEEVVINDEHDTAELRPAKRPRTLDNLHGLAIERQLSEIANSGGGGGAMPTASALQPAQSAGVLKGHRKQPLYSEDARLISGLEEALRNGNAANHTARDYAGSLLSLGRWLFANNKDPIAARLDDQSLTNDAREAIKKGLNRRRLLLAIDHLRTSQSTGGIVPIAGRAKLNPYPQDVALIKEYKNKAATGTVRTYAVVLNSFSDYLRENNKKGIAARLSGKALDGDVESYRKDAGGNRNIGAALADLRKSQAGAKAMERERHISPGPDPENAVLMEPMPAGGAAAQHSASQDAGSWPKELLPVEGYDQDLLWELMDEPGPSSSLLEPAARHDQSSDPGESIRPLNWGSDRQQFPDEPIGALAKSNLLPSKEVLINDEHDTAELRPAKRPRTLDNLHGVAIERQLSEIVASGGRLLTSAPTHQLGASPWQAQPTMQGSGYQDATALQRAVSRPLVLPEGYNQDLRLMVEDGPPWPGVPPEQAQDIVQAGQQEPAWSASTWSPQMPLNFDWSMWPMLEASPAQAARARSSTYGGLEPFLALNAPTPSELGDDAHFAPAHSTRAPSDIYAGLEPFLALNAPTPSELRDDAHFEPAQAAGARSSTYGGPPLVDLTAATPSESRDDVNSVPAFPSTSYDAQIGALGPTASPHGRGLVLEDTEWLGDEHVLRDYQLLAQELGGNNPNLAARTRFVDPLITLVSLRLGTESEMLRAFQRIVHDQNGDDTADFLFLPVNNARATNLPGTHWSLLFVDRRDRERPVAYRYDSMGEYNNTPAAELAARLGARLESRGMTQQLNTYDCGVFVVDGTRALVRQLEQGRAPHLLNLSSLVANRQALQNRLRG
ncbi:hypothetical protein HAP47_0034320 [Bradyrhizobium sp. 41S5]|uniref:Ulp1 family isopeptidase n=1 Tax=Bradyrhizobium sp. 41S5 TaxID=1404443 RepID=UPI001E40EB26|nr:Ulp1 family isopeptidase [Bradyrhizobium sp. 41S5]UFX44186.1 hypothetical protein HAP47_0034320 [Bradyrhizobium sp. 41S5]